MKIFTNEPEMITDLPLASLLSLSLSLSLGDLLDLLGLLVSQVLQVLRCVPFTCVTVHTIL
uniref:Uncharacterized protein n=1 Tax=Anguilla anguilla TaxID=7936 RepID=A0A0E9T5D1_ANGAN